MKAAIYGPIDTGFSGKRFTLKCTDYTMRKKTFLKDLVWGFETLTALAESERDEASSRVKGSARCKMGATIISGFTSVGAILKHPRPLNRLAARLPAKKYQCPFLRAVPVCEGSVSFCRPQRIRIVFCQ